VSVDAVVPLPLAVPVDVVLPLPSVVVSVVVDDGATKLMLSDEPDATLVAVIAALSPEAADPSLANGLEPDADGPEPAVTLNVSVPGLDSSHGNPEAAGPPFRLAPITYRFLSVVSTAHCPAGSPGVPAG